MKAFRKQKSKPGGGGRIEIVTLVEKGRGSYFIIQRRETRERRGEFQEVVERTGNG